MKVRDLKALLANLDDDIIVAIEGDDHSYREAHVQELTAVYHSRFDMFFEDYEREELGDNEERLPILWVG